MSATFICAFASITNASRPVPFAIFTNSLDHVWCIVYRVVTTRPITFASPGRQFAYFASFSFARFIATSPW
jgi:hypothetical protein